MGHTTTRNTGRGAGRDTTGTLAPAAAPHQVLAVVAAAVLLAALAAGAGLGPAGMLAGLVYVAALLWLLTRALRGATPGPADHVTLGRAVLVGGVTALVVDGLVTGATAVPALVGLAAVALALDAVDGRVARRTGTASATGARFDMEVDAFLVAVLSVHVAPVLGAWVLAIGAMRYVFVLAGYAWPWLRATLPPSYAAKTVAAVQGVVLVVAAAGVLAPEITTALVAVALASLCWSFGRDLPRLHRRTRV